MRGVFKSTGIALPADGSEDHQIRINGLPDYRVTPVNELAAAHGPHVDPIAAAAPVATVAAVAPAAVVAPVAATAPVAVAAPVAPISAAAAVCAARAATVCATRSAAVQRLARFAAPLAAHTVHSASAGAVVVQDDDDRDA